MLSTETVVSIAGLVLGTAAGLARQSLGARSSQRKWEGKDAAAEHSRRLLKRCCARGTQAVLVDVASGATCPVQFVRVTGGEVTVRGTQPMREEVRWMRHALVAVQFNVDGGARVFVSPLKEIARTSDQALELTTILPKFIAHNDVRAAFRVAIPPDKPLRAQLQHAHGELSSEVVDVSTVGIGLRCRLGDLQGLPVSSGDAVRVTVSTPQTEVVRCGVVRRQQGSALGVAFALDEEATQEQETYLAFVRSLVDREAA